ncbi:MAG TPA: hypothetical protein VGL72_15870 [Bryobacteraceae bacterium]
MTSTINVFHVLFQEFFERGLRYFLPTARIEISGSTASHTTLDLVSRTDGKLLLSWFGQEYLAEHPRGTFTENEIRVVVSVGSVLAARFRSFFNTTTAATTLALFRGLPEDRYISAFLDPFPYMDENQIPARPDYIADAIEVLRESSLLTFENRRISTGALLFGAGPRHQPDLCHKPPEASPEAINYTSTLTSIKSFHRLCDGIHTLFLVNRAGLLVDLVDIRDWTCMFKEADLPAPTADLYRPHCLATLQGGHIAMVLTPNGEIKVMAHGSQIFNFLGGRWRLTDCVHKFDLWRENVGNAALAERLFSAALNLAEDRRGGLFVVLDDPRRAQHFVPIGELLHEPQMPKVEPGDLGTKDQIHYLLRHKQVLGMAPALLETIARMDGGLVMDRESNLLAFGAILRNTRMAGMDDQILEGGRTTAAVGASQFGNVLKISEDGLISHYKDGALVWEL